MLNNEQNIINDCKSNTATNSNFLPHNSNNDGNICNVAHNCHRPLRLWSIKYTVIGFSKFTGVAIVQAATLKEAECVFKQNSKFNGFIDRIKINCIEEVLPNPEPLLLQEDTVAILDKSVLKSYPFLLKSEYCDKLNELEGKFIEYANDLKEEINLDELNEKIEDIDTIQKNITLLEKDKQDKISVSGDNVHLTNNILSVDKQQSSDFDIKDLADSTNLRTTWNDKQEKLAAGENIKINNNIISAVDTKYEASDFDIKDLADSTNLKNKWDDKQNKLTAGDRIKIEGNVISAIGIDINDDVITNQTTWSSEKISDKISKALGNIDLTNFVIVDELPTENISTNVIYLIGKEGSDTIKEEYVYSDGNWVFIGDTEIDLSNYYTKDEVDKKLAQNQVLKAGAAININNNNINVKYDPNWLKIDSLGRLTLKYPIKYWDELDSEDSDIPTEFDTTDETEEISGNYLKQVEDLDSYIGNEGEIVQYVGATNDKYINGYVYQYIPKENTGTIIESGTKFIIINNNSLIPDGTYVYVETVDNEVSISINKWTGEDGKKYFSSDERGLRIGDKVWDEEHNLYTISDIESTLYTIKLTDGVLIYMDTSNIYISKIDKYVNSNNDCIYVSSLSSVPIIGIYRDRPYLYSEGLMVNSDPVINGAFDSTVYNTSYEWVQKDVQPNQNNDNEWTYI